MGEYIGLDEVLMLANKAYSCNLISLPRKKIMFQGIMPDGKNVILCSPQAKVQPKGFYWVDITQEQANVLNEGDKSFVFFRLQGRNLITVKWDDLKRYLTDDCMRYNTNEQNHWKLNIYTDHIKISGNNNEMPTEIYHYAPAK